MRIRLAMCAVLLVPLAALAGGCVACVKFNGLPDGTEWNGDDHSPGDVVHTEEGIKVRLEKFKYSGGGSDAFRKAYVAPRFTPDGGAHSVRTDNINLEFDFSGLSWTPNRVTLDFYDTVAGHGENLSINGAPIIVGQLTSGSAPGLTWTVTETPTNGNRIGKLTIEGKVKKLRIGGQEFWIDTICAKWP